ncbi:hypothetical protein BDD12DRAFT_924808 [Trichophaea hybrida]|nr:hypothetical protein BDD12DRAFT_924808 [Trichophaea hybrida]
MVLAESKNRVGLGRALMRSRGGGTRVTRGSGQAGRGKGRGSQGPMEMAFAPERKEADWVKIRSITEQNDLDEFLATAEMADTDFTAEKMNHVQVVHQDQYNPYILTADQERKVVRKQAAHSQHLTVPRRPKWDSQTTPQELEQLERESFLSWRRGLAELQETKDMLMTPFERNLEVWRQLWRVIERSDLVVQIVDARNPLLFRCVDLEKYVQEVDPKKKNLLLVNKADMMTTEQRKLWADYFEKEGVSYRFFSAALARAVGYPNVGKSSTINALMGSKKVSVSSTPGKTKHFQTLHLSDRIILCDCPGLVFPNFASTKAELVCNGILPIDQQREFTGPATLVAQRIPQWFLEALYGIKIITCPLEEGGTGIPTGTELLVAYARARGFMKTSAGNPDDSRAARYVLKDYINGKLLFCHPPPGGTNPTEFNAGLYKDESRLPKHRRKLPGHNEDAVSVIGGEEEEKEMISLAPPPEGRKTAAMDAHFFGRGVGAGGHLSNPFLAASSASSAAGGGRVLSGRKAKTMIAIENNLSPDEVAALKGSKKHFKGGKRKKQVKRVEEDGEVLS